MRRAKIVATLGPASVSPDVIHKLIESGVDVARLNFSHGDREHHAQILEHIRSASRKLAKAVGVLQDLQGPKIRTGPLKAGDPGVLLVPGAEIAITTEGEIQGDEKLISTTYAHLAQDVRPSDRLLVDDGLIELQVVSTDGVRARCRVMEGGVLGEHKGINLPGVRLRAQALSEKDKEDLAFGLAHGVDFVALSFVRSPDDVALCRAEMQKAGRVVPIIAKIEKPEALDNLSAILGTADGLMVARGDLGVEILPERVPTLQKGIVREGNAAGKPVIIATQMLDSMMVHPHPTRAEATDVANAIWDGADAVMLSGETASGAHPALAVEMMDRIVREAEAHPLVQRPIPAVSSRFTAVIAAAACRAAGEAGARFICCFTANGTTARYLAHFRSPVPIIAFSSDQAIRRRLSLYWGVVPKVMEPVPNDELMVDMVSQRLVEDGHAKVGDRVVIVYGSTLGVSGQTNSMRLYRVGDKPPRPPVLA